MVGRCDYVRAHMTADALARRPRSGRAMRMLLHALVCPLVALCVLLVTTSAAVARPLQTCPTPEPTDLQPFSGWYATSTPTLSAVNEDSASRMITFYVYDQ